MLSIQVRVPAALSAYTAGKRELRVAGATVGEALGSLTERYPRLRRHLYTESGQLRDYVNVYLNEEDVRELAGEATAVAEGDTITVIPSIAGGSHGGPTARLTWYGPCTLRRGAAPFSARIVSRV